MERSDPKISDVHHVIPKSQCPRCSKFLDRATCANGEASPKEGDCTICIECGQWLVFCEGLAMRTMEEREIVDLPDEHFQMLSQVGRVIAQVKTKGTGKKR